MPVESMNTSLFRLNRTIGEAASGKSKDAAALFGHLGISLRDGNGHMLSSAELLPKLADAFQRTTDPAMRARMAMVLFGRGGKDMIPLLMGGREELEKFSRESDALNYPFTAADQKNLENYHRSMGKMSAAVSGFSGELGAKLAPALQPVVDMVTQWVAVNRDWITTGIADAVRDFTGYVKSVNWSEVGQKIRTFGGDVDYVAGLFGGWRRVIEGLMTLMVTRAVISFSMPFVRVVGAIGRATAALARYKVAATEAAAAGDAAAAAGGKATRGRGLMGAAAKAGGVALVADAVLGAVDPNDKAGSWMDKHVPGAAWLDNLASHIGMGRSYQEQSEADPSLAPHVSPLPNLYGPRVGAPAPAGEAGQNGTTRTEIVIKGLPQGSTVNTTTSGNVAKPDVDVGYNLAGVGGYF